MCYWGQAFALGPNLNAPMTPEREKEAARGPAEGAGAAPGAARCRARALIEALALRYCGCADERPRPPLDRAYAAAMKALAAAFPHDPDVQTLYADALMNTMPWDYWQKDGRSRSRRAGARARRSSG